MTEERDRKAKETAELTQRVAEVVEGSPGDAIAALSSNLHKAFRSWPDKKNTYYAIQREIDALSQLQRELH